MSLFLVISQLLFLLVAPQQVQFEVQVDDQANHLLSPLGKIVFLDPSPDSDQLVKQPFSVSVSVQLQLATNYDDWMICYAIDGVVNSHTPPYCMSIILKDGGLMFLPRNASLAPPMFDNLEADYDNRVVAWFASIKSDGAVKWGLSSCPFKVAKAVPKLKGGALQYLQNDVGDYTETDRPAMILDGQLKVFTNPEHFESKKTISISGAVIDQSSNLNRLLHAIKNVMKELPMVRPIHFFHRSSFHCNSTSTRSSLGDIADDTTRELCYLADLEAVVLHPLTIDYMTPKDRNNLMKSAVFYRRTSGSDRLFVFDEFTTICSHPLTPKGRSKLVRDFASNFDFIQCGSRAGFSLRHISHSLTCAAAYGAMTGVEDEGHFFQRCIPLQGGRMPNAANTSRFCQSQQELQLVATNGGDDFSWEEKTSSLLGIHGLGASDSYDMNSKIDTFCPEYGLLRQFEWIY